MSLKKRFLYRVNEAQKKQMAWNNHDMIAAISAVRDDKMSIAQSAREHNVTRKTLDHRIKNKVAHGTRFIR